MRIKSKEFDELPYINLSTMFVCKIKVQIKDIIFP